MEYCTQNNGNCEDCSLVNYGMDCHNNPVAIVENGYCQCGFPVVSCEKHKANYEEAWQAKVRAAKTPEDIKVESEFKAWLND